MIINYFYSLQHGWASYKIPSCAIKVVHYTVWSYMDNEHIAYSGKNFTVEWYYDSRGKSAALKYYKALTMQERIKVLQWLKRMGDSGEIADITKFNYEGDQIYAFKPKPDRFLCFFYIGKKIIVTNAFRKKQQKLPDTEKERALKYKSDYETRIKRGKYYE